MVTMQPLLTMEDAAMNVTKRLLWQEYSLADLLTQKQNNYKSNRYGKEQKRKSYGSQGEPQERN